MDSHEIPGPMLQQCNTIDAYDDSIHTENRLSNVYVTRDEFLHQLAQLREDNRKERQLEFKETRDAMLIFSNHAEASYDKGLANEEKIANLEHKVGGVYQKFQELNGTVDNLSRECEILKQRMVEKIKKITEKETMERIKPTQLSPYVSNGSSTITLEMADRCAKAVFVNNDVDIKDNTEKLSSVNQKVSSIENKPRFSCEICGHGNLLKNSLISHMRKKHFLTSRGRPIGENRPQVEKEFWCTHCKNKNFVHAKTCAKHESVCVQKPKPTTASATMESSSVQESGKLDPSISLATADEFTDGPTN